MSHSNQNIKQKFFRDANLVKREITFGRNTFFAKVKSSKPFLSEERDFFVSSLDREVEFGEQGSKKITYIDLFCGGGGLSLGVHNAFNFFGIKPKLVLAADLDSKALGLVKQRFNSLYSINDNVTNLVKFSIDHSGNSDDFIHQPEFYDSRIANLKGKIDLLVGGPPCQGHSNLNNKTRRIDERNDLYYIMPAFAIGLSIPIVIIENVEAIKFSNEDVVGISSKIFKKHGYHLYERNLSSESYGVAQTRGRHFLIASKKPLHNLDQMIDKLKSSEELRFDDINQDLPDIRFQNKTLTKEPEYSEKNKNRINFLHDNDLYNLPSKERPTCHQDGHTYSAVYGRIFPERASPTITTGFYSPGRGRYIHPHERRTINAREAGRIQSFPDYYWKDAEKLGFLKAQYAKIIGDAVPSGLVFPLVAAISEAHFF